MKRIVQVLCWMFWKLMYTLSLFLLAPIIFLGYMSIRLSVLLDEMEDQAYRKWKNPPEDYWD